MVSSWFLTALDVLFLLVIVFSSIARLAEEKGFCASIWVRLAIGLYAFGSLAHAIWLMPGWTPVLPYPMGRLYQDGAMAFLFWHRASAAIHAAKARLR